MLRSIQKAFDIIKKDDPDTSITIYTLRKWCKEGKIQYLTSGNKILVDLESLLSFLNITEKKNEDKED